MGESKSERCRCVLGSAGARRKSVASACTRRCGGRVDVERGSAPVVVRVTFLWDDGPRAGSVEVTFSSQHAEQPQPRMDSDAHDKKGTTLPQVVLPHVPARQVACVLASAACASDAPTRRRLACACHSSRATTGRVADARRSDLRKVSRRAARAHPEEPLQGGYWRTRAIRASTPTAMMAAASTHAFKECFRPAAWVHVRCVRMLVSGKSRRRRLKTAVVVVISLRRSGHADGEGGRGDRASGSGEVGEEGEGGDGGADRSPDGWLRR